MGIPLVMGCIDIYFHLLPAVNRLSRICYLFVMNFPRAARENATFTLFIFPFRST
jgi:hypothetical protein